jgi:hypothetical protein
MWKESIVVYTGWTVEQLEAILKNYLKRTMQADDQQCRALAKELAPEMFRLMHDCMDTSASPSELQHKMWLKSPSPQACLQVRDILKDYSPARPRTSYDFVKHSAGVMWKWLSEDLLGIEQKEPPYYGSAAGPRG